MKLLILKTGIQNREKLQEINSIFNNNPEITRWTIDLEDVDKVLKIEGKDELNENNIIQLIRSCGFYCELLPD